MMRRFFVLLLASCGLLMLVPSTSQAASATKPLSISTTSVPTAYVGSAYTAQLRAAGGTGSYSWKLPNVAVGTVFNAAFTVGINLFGLDGDDLALARRRGEETSALLPKRARATRRADTGDEDF